MSDNPHQTTNAMADMSDFGGPDPNLERSVSMLRRTKPWLRFISVMTFLLSSFMVLDVHFVSP